MLATRIVGQGCQPSCWDARGNAVQHLRVNVSRGDPVGGGDLTRRVAGLQLDDVPFGLRIVLAEGARCRQGETSCENTCRAKWGRIHFHLSERVLFLG